MGWGTDDTGLITLLVHLSERQRRDLVDKYAEVKNGGDLFQAGIGKHQCNHRCHRYKSGSDSTLRGWMSGL